MKFDLINFDDLIDVDVLWYELMVLIWEIDGDGLDLKVCSVVFLKFKDMVKMSWKCVEEKLSEDGGGLLCVQCLFYVQDDLIWVIYDFVVCYVYWIQNLFVVEWMLVVVVGGYGCGMFVLGFDIDLLFVLFYKQIFWGEQIVEYIFYMLWDLGFKVGYVIWNIDECICLVKVDMIIWIVVLEVCYIWGDRLLFDELIVCFDKEVVEGISFEFIVVKLKECDECYQCQGMLWYLVELNIKEGKGGLCDFNILFWIVKYYYWVGN